MHTLILTSIVAMSDLLLPMPGGGFSYNGSVYMPTPGGGWIWPEGTIQPMPGGGAWGHGWETFPGLGAVLPSMLENRPVRPRFDVGPVNPWIADEVPIRPRRPGFARPHPNPFGSTLPFPDRAW